MDRIRAIRTAVRKYERAHRKPYDIDHLREYVSHKVKKSSRRGDMSLRRAGEEPTKGLLVELLDDGHEDKTYMSDKHLKQIAHQAEEMSRIVGDNAGLDDWAESHISEAASKLDSVYK